MSKTYAFPVTALRQLIKKTIMFMPTDKRKMLKAKMENKGFNLALEDKIQRLVVVIMRAKTCETEEEFSQELIEGLSFELDSDEFFLMDGFLGGQKSMMLEFVRKGISPERLARIKDCVQRCQRA